MTIDRGVSQSAEGAGHAIVLETPIGQGGSYDAIAVHRDGAYSSTRNANDDVAGVDDNGAPYRLYALRPRVAR